MAPVHVLMPGFRGNSGGQMENPGNDTNGSLGSWVGVLYV